MRLWTKLRMLSIFEKLSLTFRLYCIPKTVPLGNCDLNSVWFATVCSFQGVNFYYWYENNRLTFKAWDGSKWAGPVTLHAAMKKKREKPTLDMCWLYIECLCFIGNQSSCAANDSHIVSIDFSAGKYNPSSEMYQILLTLKRRSFPYPPWRSSVVFHG